MNSSYAENTLREIERQIAEIEAFKLDEKQNSYFSKYLVVFICGCFESIIESILCQYVEKHRDIRIANYISESLDISFRNPDMEKIISLLRRFDNSWSDKVSQMPNVNIKGVDSIVSHKNELAHTGNSSVTMHDIKELYNRAKPVILLIDQLVFEE